MALSDSAIRAFRPSTKDYTVADEKGLCLLIRTNGSKLWRYRYRVSGKMKVLALGGHLEEWRFWPEAGGLTG